MERNGLDRSFDIVQALREEDEWFGSGMFERQEKEPSSWDMATFSMFLRLLGVIWVIGVALSHHCACFRSLDEKNPLLDVVIWICVFGEASAESMAYNEMDDLCDTVSNQNNSRFLANGEAVEMKFSSQHLTNLLSSNLQTHPQHLPVQTRTKLGITHYKVGTKCIKTSIAIHNCDSNQHYLISVLQDIIFRIETERLCETESYET